ncbi:MAG: 50S ribosomal protein L5 [Alphaproteobacteria bacterium]
MAKTRYQELYENEIVPALQEKYGYKNVHQVPKLEKIVINMGVGQATQDRKHIENAVADMAAIAGQKPVVNKAKQSNASFKVREGQAIGCKVTLRRAQMYEFLDRLVTITMPRIRDFRGINGKSFDGRGNYAMGMDEQIVFPEIDYDKVDQIRGMDIVICTSANNNEEAKELLKGFKLPFKN